MSSHQQSATAGYMFLFSGTAFLVAAAIGGQIAFVGVGAAFIALGGGLLYQARKGR